MTNIKLQPRVPGVDSLRHYNDVIRTTLASQITSLAVVYSTVYSVADQRKHQSSSSLAFVWGIHHDRWIPRTKGQLRGKCFHLMTSSWKHIDLCFVSSPKPGKERIYKNSCLVYIVNILAADLIVTQRAKASPWWRHQMETFSAFSGHRWIPRTKASDAELWCFLWSASE